MHSNKVAMPRRSSATSLIISGTNRAQPAEVQFRYSRDAEGGAGMRFQVRVRTASGRLLINRNLRWNFTSSSGIHLSSASVSYGVRMERLRGRMPRIFKISSIYIMICFLYILLYFYLFYWFLLLKIICCFINYYKPIIFI